MNNKILIGSIIAVAVLIGVSFTSVVGYRSVDSDVKASPLFNIRSSKAIDKESKDLSCEYVGDGEVINLSIPTRDNAREQVEKIIKIIRKIDDKAFRLFIQIALKEMNRNNILSKEITQVQLQTLYNIKNNPDDLIVYLNILERDKSDPPTGWIRADECCGTFNNEICLLILAIILILAYIAEYIFVFFCYIIPAIPTFE